MARIAGIHISACESPKTTIVLVDFTSPRWQMGCVVGSCVVGSQPSGNWYASSRRCESGGVRSVGTAAPVSAVFTAATTAGNVVAFGTPVASATFAVEPAATAAL